MRLPDFENAQQIYLPGATLSAIEKYGINIVKTVKKYGISFYLTGIIHDSKDIGVNAYPECLFYVLKGGILYPRMAYRSLSRFKGFEEVLPHPLTVCKNAEIGSTWEFKLRHLTTTDK